jgi:hypothetical protein
MIFGLKSSGNSGGLYFIPEAAYRVSLKERTKAQTTNNWDVVKSARFFESFLTLWSNCEI